MSALFAKLTKIHPETANSSISTTPLQFDDSNLRNTFEIRVWSSQRPRVAVPEKSQEECLLFFYKGLHGLSAIPCGIPLRRPVDNSRHSDSETFTALSYRLDCYTRSSLEPFQNGINHLLSPRSAVLKSPGTVENNFWAIWHSGSNGRMSIAGYLLKNRRMCRNNLYCKKWQSTALLVTFLAVIFEIQSFCVKRCWLKTYFDIK